MSKQTEIEKRLHTLYDERRETDRKVIQRAAQEQENSLAFQIALLEKQRGEIVKDGLIKAASALQTEADTVIVSLFQSIKAVNECANRLKELQRDYLKLKPHGKFSELNTYSLDIDNHAKTTRLWLNVFTGDTIGIRGKLAQLVHASDKVR